MSHQENQSPAESIKDVELIEHTQSNCEGEETDLQTNTKSKRKPKLVKPATSKKERKRTQNINAAFADLRKHIPNVPTDTKLSKIKTLKLAMSYIHHLEFQLEGEEHCVTLRERSESTTQTEPTEVSPVHSRKNSESSYEELEEAPRFSSMSRRSSRTGWPQHVWALELAHGKPTSTERKTLQQVAV